VTRQMHRAAPGLSVWRWPLDPASYDRSPVLAAEEREALTALGSGLREWRTGRGAEWAIVERLSRPLADARIALDVRGPRQARISDRAVAELLLDTLARGEPYWAWSSETWVGVLGQDQRSFFAAHPRLDRGDLRQHMIAIAYLLQCFIDLPRLGQFERETLALKVFGRPHVAAAVTAVTEVLAGWGYADHGVGRGIRRVLCEALLVNRSPLLGDLTVEVLDDLRQRFSPGSRANLHQIHRALAALGLIPGPVAPEPPPATLVGGDPAWSAWVLRWEATSTLTPSTRRHARSALLKVGRWLAAVHPDIREPSQWTRDTCAAAVAAVDRMRVGDHVARRDGLHGRVGKPLAARSKDDYLSVLRQFFRDCAEWGWIPRRFDELSSGVVETATDDPLRAGTKTA
jgi:hypothetical protein